MRIRIIKGEGRDRIEVARSDGSHVSTELPHKGPVPHDAVHFFVESALEMTNGFWGMVAAGRHPEEIAAIAKAAGHASAKRASMPDRSIVPALQAERLVECFEADLWSAGTSDAETLRAMLAAGCAQSNVGPPDLGDEQIDAIRASLAKLREQWTDAHCGQELVLDWEAGAAG